MERCPETLFREPWHSIWFTLVCVGVEGDSMLVKQSWRKSNMEVSIVRAFSVFRCIFSPFFFFSWEKKFSCVFWLVVFLPFFSL